MKPGSMATNCALAVFHLASTSPSRACSSATLGKAAGGIPPRTMMKGLKRLVAAGILRSTSGPNGGYRLRRAPERVTLLDVIEAVEGPIVGIVPADDTPAVRALEAACKCAAQGTRAELADWTFARLIRRPDHAD